MVICFCGVVAALHFLINGFSRKLGTANSKMGTVVYRARASIWTVSPPLKAHFRDLVTGLCRFDFQRTVPSGSQSVVQRRSQQRLAINECHASRSARTDCRFETRDVGPQVGLASANY